MVSAVWGMPATAPEAQALDAPMAGDTGYTPELVVPMPKGAPQGQGYQRA